MDTQASCSCCGNSFDRSRLAALSCHPETTICVGCIQWLATQAGMPRAIPVLATTDMEASLTFWAAAGFDVAPYDDSFAIATGHGTEIHLAATTEPVPDVCGVYLQFADISAIHTEWLEAGLDVSDPDDEEWGMREFTVIDPSGNTIRVGQNI